MSMPLSPGWEDIALRLLATLVGAGIIGLDREVKGHAAGLRTTILVALAAALAMTQANILLPMDGKAQGGFSSMDVMRLPLGILTGVGFIGGGAILKQGASIRGLTTAATLWIVTAIGLCFGGGQYGLGAAGTALAFVVLWGMAKVDDMVPRQHRALLIIGLPPGAAPPDLDARLAPLGFAACLVKLRRPLEGEAEAGFDVRWQERKSATQVPGLIEAVSVTYPVRSFHIVSQASR
jgi:putative Mg2+ transporter-C (MgtC) family protein